MKLFYLMFFFLCNFAIADGPCEGYFHHIKYIGYSAKFKQFAIHRTLEFCAQDENLGYDEIVIDDPKAKGGKSTTKIMNPNNFSFEFADIIDVNGNVKKRFLWSGLQKELDKLSHLKTNAYLPKELLPYIENKVMNKSLITKYLQEGLFKKQSDTKSYKNCKLELIGKKNETKDADWKMEDSFLKIMDTSSNHIADIDLKVTYKTKYDILRATTYWQETSNKLFLITILRLTSSFGLSTSANLTNFYLFSSDFFKKCLTK